MRNAYIAVAICLLGSGFDPAAAAASDSTAASNNTKPKAASDDDWVCQKIVVTGSRIGAKKFCASREQWEQQRLLDRQAIEKVQASPCVITGTTPTGRPSC